MLPQLLGGVLFFTVTVLVHPQPEFFAIIVSADTKSSPLLRQKHLMVVMAITVFLRGLVISLLVTMVCGMSFYAILRNTSVTGPMRSRKSHPFLYSRIIEERAYSLCLL